MNVINITGNLGRDCEVRQAGSTTVCDFPVAVSSGYGEKAKTNWVKCQVWGKRAEGELPQYLKKGQQVAVSGEFNLDEYTSKEGEKRTTLVVNVNSLDLVGGKKEGGQSQEQSAPQAPASDDFDDDIPF